MSFRRQIDWTKARQDLTRDRAAAAAPAANPMFLASMARAKALTAIMKAALASALAERARGNPLPFSQLMASALRTA